MNQPFSLFAGSPPVTVVRSGGGQPRSWEIFYIVGSQPNRRQPNALALFSAHRDQLYTTTRIGEQQTSVTCLFTTSLHHSDRMIERAD